VAEDDSLSIAKLKEGMNRYIEEVRGRKVRGGGGSPTSITAIVKYFMMELVTTKFVANSNVMTDGDETKARREWNDRNFPNGTYCFTIPVDDCNAIHGLILIIPWPRVYGSGSYVGRH
jgi:hypothetical protein